MNQISQERNKQIIKYNIIGIVINLCLAFMKIIAGYMANAHAIMLDGINSLSDMISSVISILSTYLAGKRVDKNHPLGYGRLEYVSSFVVTMIVMYIGVKTIVETVDAILHPHDAPQYTTIVLIIMVVSLISKILYGLLMRTKGKQLKSVSMIMSGTDSLGDALISLAILVAAVIYRVTGIDIEHYLCIFISLMIIKTGVGMIRECTSKMLGTRIDDEQRRKILRLVTDFDGVCGVSNLVMHNYGEGYYVGSVDIEVDENMKAGEFERLTRKIIKKAAKENITLTSIGIQGVKVNDTKADDTWDVIIDIARKYKGIKRVSSCTVDFEKNELSFSVVPDYAVKSWEADFETFKHEVRELYSDMHVEINKAIDM